jgi:hypothetical protein
MILRSKKNVIFLFTASRRRLSHKNLFLNLKEYTSQFTPFLLMKILQENGAELLLNSWKNPRNEFTVRNYFGFSIMFFHVCTNDAGVDSDYKILSVSLTASY